FLDELFVIVGIRDPLEMAAERGLRFFLLRPDDGLEAALAQTDVSVAPEEIHRARAEAEQRREPRVVVVGFRDVAVLAILRRAFAAGRVRQVRVVSLAAVTFRADGLLLRINPLAVGVL